MTHASEKKPRRTLPKQTKQNKTKPKTINKTETKRATKNTYLKRRFQHGSLLVVVVIAVDNLQHRSRRPNHMSPLQPTPALMSDALRTFRLLRYKPAESGAPSVLRKKPKPLSSREEKRRLEQGRAGKSNAAESRIEQSSAAQRSAEQSREHSQKCQETANSPLDRLPSYTP